MTTERWIIERKDERALGKMAGWVKWHCVKWNWVNCHATDSIISNPTGQSIIEMAK